MAAVLVTKDNFQQEVLESNLPVLVDFFAGWCGPCQMLGPVIKELSTELEGKVKVCKINVDDEPDIAEQYRVMSIPKLVVIKDGQEVKSALGYQSKEEILKLLEV